MLSIEKRTVRDIGTDIHSLNHWSQARSRRLWYESLNQEAILLLAVGDVKRRAEHWNRRKPMSKRSSKMGGRE
jgi:hypothetical protein